MTIIVQMLGLLAMLLALGPWMTLSGLRVIRNPSRIEEKRIMNRLIQWASRSPLYSGNIRLCAWMLFLEGAIFDLVAIFALVVLIYHAFHLIPQ